VLEPPEGDIHRVAATSAVPSVSVHLLGNDTGCVWRHAYEPAEGSVWPFRSGWSNVPCREEGEEPEAAGGRRGRGGGGMTFTATTYNVPATACLGRAPGLACRSG
jgi:hypothetical protein